MPALGQKPRATLVGATPESKRKQAEDAVAAAEQKLAQAKRRGDKNGIAAAERELAQAKQEAEAGPDASSKKEALPKTETSPNQGNARKRLAPVVHAINFANAIESLTKNGRTPAQARVDRQISEREVYSDMRVKNELQAKLQVATAECEKLRAALYAEKKEKRLVLNEIQNARRQYTKLEVKMKEINIDHGSLQSEMEYITTEQEAIHERTHWLGYEQTALENQLLVQRRARTLLQQQSTLAFRETRSLNAQRARTLAEVERMRKDLAAVEADVEVCKMTIKKEEGIRDDLQDKVEVANELTKQLRLEITTAREKKREKESAVAEAEGEVEDLNRSVNLALDDLRGFERKLGKLKQSKEVWETKIEKGTTKNALIIEDLQEAKLGNDDLHEHLGVIGERMYELEAAEEDRKKRLKEAGIDTAETDVSSPSASPATSRAATTAGSSPAQSPRAGAAAAKKGAQRPGDKSGTKGKNTTGSPSTKKNARGTKTGGSVVGEGNDLETERKQRQQVEKELELARAEIEKLKSEAKEGKRQDKKTLSKKPSKLDLPDAGKKTDTRGSVKSNRSSTDSRRGSSSRKKEVAIQVYPPPTRIPKQAAIDLGENPHHLYVDRTYTDPHGDDWDLETVDSTSPPYAGDADLSHLGFAPAKDPNNPFNLYKDKVYTDDEGIEWELEAADSEQASYKGDADLSHLGFPKPPAIADDNPFNLYKDKTYTDDEGMEWDLEAADSEQASYKGDADLSHLGFPKPPAKADENPFNLYKDKTYTDEEGMEWDLEAADSEQTSYIGDADLSHLGFPPPAKKAGSPVNFYDKLYKDKTYVDEEGMEWDLEVADSEQASYKGDADFSHLGFPPPATADDNPFRLYTDPVYTDDEGVDWDLEAVDSEAEEYKGDADFSHLKMKGA